MPAFWELNKEALLALSDEEIKAVREETKRRAELSLWQKFFEIIQTVDKEKLGNGGAHQRLQVCSNLFESLTEEKEGRQAPPKITILSDNSSELGMEE